MQYQQPIIIATNPEDVSRWVNGGDRSGQYLGSDSSISSVRTAYNVFCALASYVLVSSIHAALTEALPGTRTSFHGSTLLTVLSPVSEAVYNVCSPIFGLAFEANPITNNWVMNNVIMAPLSAIHNYMVAPICGGAFNSLISSTLVQNLCLVPVIDPIAVFFVGMLDGLANKGRFFDSIVETESHNLDFLFSAILNRQFLNDVYNYCKHGGVLKYMLREQYLFWFHDDLSHKLAKLTSIFTPSDFRTLSVPQEQIIEEYLLQFNDVYRNLRKDLDIISCMVRRGFNVNHRFEYRYHYDLLYRIYQDSKNEPFEYNRYFKDYLINKFNTYKFDYAPQQPQDPQYFGRYPNWQLGAGETNLEQPLYGVMRPEVASAAELYDFEFFVKKVQRVYDKLWLDMKSTKENAKREYVAKLYWPEWLVKNFLFDPRLVVSEWYTDKELEKRNIEIKRDEPNFLLFHSVSIPLWWADMILLPTHLAALGIGIVGKAGATLGKWLRWYDDDNPVVMLVDNITDSISEARDRVLGDVEVAWNLARVESVSWYEDAVPNNIADFLYVPVSEISNVPSLDW